MMRRMTSKMDYPVLMVGSDMPVRSRAMDELRAQFPGYRLVVVAGVSGIYVVDDPRADPRVPSDSDRAIHRRKAG